MRGVFFSCRAQRFLITITISGSGCAQRFLITITVNGIFFSWYAERFLITITFSGVFFSLRAQRFFNHNHNEWFLFFLLTSWKILNYNHNEWRLFLMTCSTIFNRNHHDGCLFLVRAFSGHTRSEVIHSVGLQFVVGQKTNQRVATACVSAHRGPTEGSTCILCPVQCSL